MGKIKHNLIFHSRKVKKPRQKPQQKLKNIDKPRSPPVTEYENESDDTEDLMEMMDEDDLEYLTKKAGKLNKRLSLLDSVDLSLIESNYEKGLSQKTSMNTRQLPVKTNAGLTYEAEDADENKQEEVEEERSVKDEVDTLEEDDTEKLITSANLLYTRSKDLEYKKIQIGSLSASILEDPREKLHHFKTLLDILNADDTGSTIKKLVILSLLEVFKDILPSYQIKQSVDKNVKLKKETLKLERYETTLLQYYKKFLRSIQRIVRLASKRKNRLSQFEGKLGELSLNALCELLRSHPYFNYAENIAEIVVPFLNDRSISIRTKVNDIFKSVFTEDKKGEISLKIVRSINKMIKKYEYEVHSDMIQVLLHLNIRDVNLDRQNENQLKHKKLMSRKGNILRLSKYERKRKVHLEKLDKELLEVKAEEHKDLKRRYHTEITKIMFGIFFKILKSSESTKILDVSLRGITMYAHCINVEFYIDLIKILEDLLIQDYLGYRERQLCIQTVFQVLAKQGEALNVDPTKFYTTLYCSLLTTDAAKSHDISTLVETLVSALLSGHKRIPNKRAISFVKRTATMTLQLLHNGSIACLEIIKVLLQSYKATDILLDLESSSGEGSYLPELDDPEYCRASDSALYELTLLGKHYHPVVINYSRCLARGTSLTDNSSNIFPRTSPIQLLSEFNTMEMSFNPSIPIPKKMDSGKFTLKRKFRSDFEDKMLRIVKRTRINNGIFVI